MQYGNDAAEIKIRRADLHVIMHVFGNVIHDVQSLEVYDSTFSHCVKKANKKSQ